MAGKFHRASSAVEGRNGYLSHRHHAARGFWDHHLQVLTVIHNFDLQRSDGTTAAQRLFGRPFPNLFKLTFPVKSRKACSQRILAQAQHIRYSD